MNNPPRVSVGLPVYNGERCLAATVETILAQTFKDFELIIADNASTDATAQIGQDFAKRDPRVRYVRNPTNIGAIANFNLVFKLARGEYFKWNGYDDEIAPDYLEKCVRILDANPDVIICQSRTQVVNLEGRIVPSPDPQRRLNSDRIAERFRDVLLQTHHINENYGVIRSDVLRQTELEQPYHGSDKVLLADLMVLGKCYEIPEFLFTRGTALAKAQYTKTRRTLYEYVAPHAEPALAEVQIFLGYCRVVWTRPMPFKERLGCLRALLSYAFGAASWKRRMNRLLRKSPLKTTTERA
jgi:glycosyltransferase involved in cell wall biosynthesis